jgi:alcohol dehydrogenase class IV
LGPESRSGLGSGLGPESRSGLGFGAGSQPAGDTTNNTTTSGANNLNSREGKKQALVLALRQAIFDLLETCEQPKSIAELGISEAAFRQALPELTNLAFNDLSIRTNPCMPLQEEVVQLLLESYPPRTRP